MPPRPMISKLIPDLAYCTLSRESIDDRFPMQTLGLADSTPRSENRLKALLWPSIQSATDVDYLGTQGYWICVLVALMSGVVIAVNGQPLTGLLTFLFFFLSGVGVREHNRYAALGAFLFYGVDIILGQIGIVKIIFTAILLSNVRATWIASKWKPDSEESIPPPRLNQTLGDKLADILPAWLWPKVRIAYYIYSSAMLLLVFAGLIIARFRHTG